MFFCIAFVMSALLCAAIGASAETYGDLEYRVNDDGTIAITGCDSSATSVEIPGSIDGISVTEIDSRAFFGCTELANITIPDEVTSIGMEAFSNTAIYNNASNWENGVLYIGNYLIKADEDISGEYVIKNGTKYIADYAFCYRTSLTNVTIPGSVVSVGDWAFNRCTGLINVSLLDGVISIGSNAFSECAGLINITIPDTVTSVSSEAFYDTAIYNNASNWQDGILYVGNYLIEADENISGEYVIKNGTKGIADSAFYGCINLTSITIPNGVTSIGDSAFSNCENLTRITIPESVTKIADAFHFCQKLWIDVSESNKTYASQDGVLFNKGKTELLVYAKSEVQSIYNIPDGVKSIGNHAFYHCYNLSNVTLPDSVINIGDGAFFWCYNLTNITIPDSVTTIAARAFYGCNGLTDVYYSGTESQWNSILIGEGNDPLANATIHCVQPPQITAAIPTIDNGAVSGVTVNLADVETSCVLLAVFQSGADTADIKTADISAGTENITVNTDAQGADSVRVFIWNSLDGMIPLCEGAKAEV